MSTIEETNIKIPNTLFKYIEEFSQTIHEETQIDYNYLYQSIYDLIVNNKYVNNNEEFPSIIENCPQDKISFIVLRDKLTFIKSQCPFCNETQHISIQKFKDSEYTTHICAKCNKQYLIKLSFDDKIINYIEK